MRNRVSDGSNFISRTARRGYEIISRHYLRTKIITREEAARLVGDGATLGTIGGGGRQIAEDPDAEHNFPLEIREKAHPFLDEVPSQ